MKFIYPLAIACAMSVIGSSAIQAQDDGQTQLKLKSGNLSVSSQSTENSISVLNTLVGSYAIITFSQLPDNEQKEFLANNGIKLLNYLPQKAFYAQITANPGSQVINEVHISAVLKIESAFKVHPMIRDDYPEWSIDENGQVNLIVNYFGSRKMADLRTAFEAFDAEVLSNETDVNRAFISINKRQVKNLFNLDYVYFIEPVDAPAHPENYGARSQHRSNMLAQEFNGGTKYDGTGVSVGMHDDGIIGPHIDYEGRLPIQFPTGNSGNHGDHVAGTIMGAGNLDPKGRGMAYGADLYVYSSSNNNFDSVTNHYNQYNVVITSKSYSNGCNAGYTSLTRKLDQQTRQLPSLIHVFSAGNDGNSDCGYGAGSGWGNITGGHKMGKNVIATGNLNSSDGLAGSSSRGPADDGRIKPDICAKGSSVYSTIDENDYGLKTGTSMACPGISGSLAQLYHAYKNLNGNANPKSGLIKGTVLNTADDLGNPGPDFKFGWGRINLRRALEVLSNNQYIQGSIAASAKDTHNITLPADVKQLRIMVYWHDYEATTSASTALVNDIDMVVIDPTSTSFQPWVLDPTPNVSALNSNAIRASDHLNNMEQVTIDNPGAGTYKVALDGFAIPQGPQEYHLVWEFVYDQIVLTYPNGGEGLVPGETEIVRWDASEDPSNFKLEYSTNGGTSWNIISTLINPTSRQLNWVVPNIPSSDCIVRLSRNADIDDSDASFTIIGEPQNLHVDWICPDSIQIGWNNVGSATSYNTYLLGNKYMDSISTTTANTYVYNGINTMLPHWVSVSANIGAGATGRRSIAIQTSTGSDNCPIINDPALSSVFSPSPGTQFSCNEIEVSVYVRNDGSNALSNIPVKCDIDGTLAMSGTLTGPVNPGDSAKFTFSTTITPTTGNHAFKCYVDFPGDNNALNNIHPDVIVQYVTGTPVTLPLNEDFESFTSCGTANNCGFTICNLSNGWVNTQSGTIDDHDWRVDQGGTASGDTGPEEDHKPGTSSGKYLYTEASEECYFKRAEMVSPCLDLTEIVKPRMAYWYHMYGGNMGSLYVDVLHNGHWYTQIKNPIEGDQGDEWFRDSLILTTFAGEMINIRFRGVTGNFFRSDMAIDDISVYETFVVIPPDGIEENSFNFEVNLFPNPANDRITLDWLNRGSDQLSLQIRDLSGKAVKQQPLSVESSTDGRTVIDISGLESGVYFFAVTDGEGERVFKVVKL